MKKRDRKQGKLHLHRETIERLSTEALSQAEGGLLYQNVMKCSGCDSGCGINPEPVYD